MKYNVSKLARMYIDFLSEKDIEVDLDISQPFDLSTYNEYTYKKLVKQFDKLYDCTDSFNLTEKFLKGD